MSKKQKLELTWIGKGQRPKLEPRILLEEPEKSYHAEHQVTEDDIFDNRLIFGDNLLALKALEQEFTGKVKCIYIDPPFNTGQALANYDDGLEHSIWLTLMSQRLDILHNLLSPDGTLFVHIDDNELGYLIVMLDEIFGRENRAYIVTFKQGAPTGHKAINPGCVSTTNFIVIYCKDKSQWKPNKLFTGRERDTRYNQFIVNPDSEFKDWKFVTLTSAFANHIGLSEKETKKFLKEDKEALNNFVIQFAPQVVRLARPDYKNVSEDARNMIDISKDKPSEVFCLNRENHSDMYFVKGERILFYKDKLKLIDGEYVSGEPLTTLWDDILSNNLHNEGDVTFPKGKKPEFLIKRVLELATNPGDCILDSFGGSGTTGAVAHKMRRRWIMVELGEHCHTHIIPRLQKVMDGTDQSGISQSVGWKGGGGFRYYRLAPSLLQQDAWGNWIINKEYKPEMLAEAVCKLAGFTYAPSETHYWMHGYSSEQDFIYVTTANLTHGQLRALSEEVGEERSLMIYCKAFKANTDSFDNLTIKKIPKSVLDKCEWDHDDYSLNVANLQPAPNPEPELTQEQLSLLSVAGGAAK